eukprot:CAMPEP_0174818002 /NCGR_PEP_ID=MMETSP1107-20130205/598_1 /TAXON_ID=36770 /ORGANISM="Paraphysomonas vestita, Strain GFlagA" /LENGTH=600 /DNA_ID=CAMNT_0016029279 /DNA_START=334 /DNA_END=2136 /DNA_ORIENTATION=-
MASSSILQRQHLCPSAMQIRTLNKKICSDLNKQNDSLISYAEFLKWSEDVVYQSIDKSTTFDVYTYFVKSCGLEIPQEIDVDAVGSGFKPDSEVDNKLYNLEINEISLNNTKGKEQFVELILGKDIFYTTNPFEGKSDSTNNINPLWNVNINLETTTSSLNNDPLKIRIKDKNGTIKDRVIGRAHVVTDKIISANGEWIDLTGDLIDSDGKVSGIYHLKARYRPLSDIPPEVKPEPEPEQIEVDTQSSKPIEDDLPYPNFTDEHTSLMRYNLTPEIFDNLKHQHTPGGVTLMQNIQSGIDVPSDIIGLTAGDADSYKTFADIFDPVIEAYQGVSLSNSDSCYVTNRDSSELERMERIDYTYVVSSHIRSKRNVSGHMFTPSITSSQRIELESLLMDALKSMKGEFAGQYHSVSDMPNNEKERLINCGLMISPPSKGSGLESSGISRNWPQGRGVFSNGTEEFAVWVNGEDHLCIVSQNQGGDIASVFEDWSTAVNGVENCLVSNGMKFEENQRLGYLTTSPSNVGTGFHASMVLRLSGLGSQESKLKLLCDELGLLAVRKLPNEDCWEIMNKTTLGKTEVDMVQQVIDGVAVLTTKQPWL